MVSENQSMLKTKSSGVDFSKIAKLDINKFREILQKEINQASARETGDR